MNIFRRIRERREQGRAYYEAFLILEELWGFGMGAWLYVGEGPAGYIAHDIDYLCRFCGIRGYRENEHQPGCLALRWDSIILRGRGQQ